MSALFKFRFVCLLVGTGLAAASGTLHAQSTKIFVASFGNDANDGSRGSPKRNFQAAHNAVAVKGEIVALDTAGYGIVNITKSVTITAPAGVTALISTGAFLNAAVTINAPGAAVSLRGLTIENIDTGFNGVVVNSVAALSLSDCVIQNFITDGIDFQPTADAVLLMTHCTVRACGGNGCYLAPTGGITGASLDGCQLESSAEGLLVSGNVFCTARDTIAAMNTNGFDARNNAVLNLQLCTASGNGAGVSSLNNATVKVDACTVSDNTSAGFSQGSGGTIFSRGNNTLSGNAGNTAFSTYSAQ
jgi:hypothetical protein